jgi:hypothetical protein
MLLNRPSWVDHAAPCLLTLDDCSSDSPPAPALHEVVCHRGHEQIRPGAADGRRRVGCRRRSDPRRAFWHLARQPATSFRHLGRLHRNAQLRGSWWSERGNGSADGLWPRGAPDQSASPWPAMSWADPRTGSNMEGTPPVGFRLAEAPNPRPPWIAAPRSVRRSPNRLDATTTSGDSRGRRPNWCDRHARLRPATRLDPGSRPCGGRERPCHRQDRAQGERSCLD